MADADFTTHENGGLAEVMDDLDATINYLSRQPETDKAATAAMISATTARATLRDNMIDVTELPIWSAYVLVEVPSNDNLPAGRFIRVGGGGVTKRQAWGIAREEMGKRPDSVAFSVRRDNESLEVVHV